MVHGMFFECVLAALGVSAWFGRPSIRRQPVPIRIRMSTRR